MANALKSKWHDTLCSYKILFLDVLFPIDVKRVIVIDADQVGCAAILFTGWLFVLKIACALRWLART